MNDTTSTLIRYYVERIKALEAALKAAKEERQSQDKKASCKCGA